jgi:hypothetical protein
MNPESLNRKAFALVSCMLALPVCATQSADALATTNPVPLGTAGPQATASPTAAELIERFGATQDRLWTSFVVTMETTSTFEGKVKERPQLRPGEWHRTVQIWEYRCDGERGYDHVMTLWDGRLSGANEMKHPGNNYSLWDGKASYGYLYTEGSLTRNSGPYGKDGTLHLSYSKPQTPHGRQTTGRTTVTRSIMGSFYGVESDELIDDELRRAANVTVRPRTETVNGSECYVVNASGAGSEYQVWIDPTHDYNVAKAIVRRNWTSFSRPEGYKTPPAAGYQVMQLTVTGFQSVDGVWLAKEADWHHETRCLNTDHTVENIHIKITKYARNPDHEALGSFKPAFIREGALVHLAAKSENYIWQRGTLVPEPTKGR